ncbi:MAG: hypothetical protein ACTSUE_20100 [Promethearchaeota archaeon]
MSGNQFMQPIDLLGGHSAVALDGLTLQELKELQNKLCSDDTPGTRKMIRDAIAKEKKRLKIKKQKHKNENKKLIKKIKKEVDKLASSKSKRRKTSKE